MPIERYHSCTGFLGQKKSVQLITTGGYFSSSCEDGESGPLAGSAPSPLAGGRDLILKQSRGQRGTILTVCSPSKPSVHHCYPIF